MKQSVGIIGKDIEVTGDIKFDGTFRVEGAVHGSIVGHAGVVSIGEGGYVNANVTANICVVEGLYEGDLTAATRVEITKTGRIKGNVTTPDLIIAEGAVFEGNLEMAKDIANMENLKTPDEQSFQVA